MAGRCRRLLLANGAAAMTNVTVTGTLEFAESVAVIVTALDTADVGEPDTSSHPMPG